VLSLHQIIFVQPAILVAAGSLGAFARNSLQVQTTNTKSSIQQRDGLLSGSYDLAITAMDNTISWSRDTGKSFRIIAQIERVTRLEIFGRDNFRRLGDLRGARLAVDAPDSGFVLVLRGTLDSAGVSPNEYTLAPLGGVNERLEALLAGNADAALLGPPLTAMAASAGLHHLATVEDIFPDYPGLGLVVRQDRLEELRPSLTAYMSALGESLAWMHSHDVELSESLIAAQFPVASIEAVLNTRPLGLRPDAEGIQRILALRRRYDPRFDASLTPNDLIDGRFLPARG
jgi:ABC-type nitrate/sulfonate/bicarbonate transport system substrate-binding protein